MCITTNYRSTKKSSGQAPFIPGSKAFILWQSGARIKQRIRPEKEAETICPAEDNSGIYAFEKMFEPIPLCVGPGGTIGICRTYVLANFDGADDGGGGSDVGGGGGSEAGEGDGGGGADAGGGDSGGGGADAGGGESGGGGADAGGGESGGGDSGGGDFGGSDNDSSGDDGYDGGDDSGSSDEGNSSDGGSDYGGGESGESGSESFGGGDFSSEGGDSSFGDSGESEGESEHESFDGGDNSVSSEGSYSGVGDSSSDSVGGSEPESFEGNESSFSSEEGFNGLGDSGESFGASEPESFDAGSSDFASEGSNSSFGDSSESNGISDSSEGGVDTGGISDVTNNQDFNGTADEETDISGSEDSSVSPGGFDVVNSNEESSIPVDDTDSVFGAADNDIDLSNTDTSFIETDSLQQAPISDPADDAVYETTDENTGEEQIDLNTNNEDQSTGEQPKEDFSSLPGYNLFDSTTMPGAIDSPDVTDDEDIEPATHVINIDNMIDSPLMNNGEVTAEELAQTLDNLQDSTPDIMGTDADVLMNNGTIDNGPVADTDADPLNYSTETNPGFAFPETNWQPNGHNTVLQQQDTETGNQPVEANDEPEIDTHHILTAGDIAQPSAFVDNLSREEARQYLLEHNIPNAGSSSVTPEMRDALEQKINQYNKAIADYQNTDDADKIIADEIKDAHKAMVVPAARVIGALADKTVQIAGAVEGPVGEAINTGYEMLKDGIKLRTAINDSNLTQGAIASGNLASKLEHAKDLLPEYEKVMENSKYLSTLSKGIKAGVAIHEGKPGEALATDIEIMGDLAKDFANDKAKKTIGIVADLPSMAYEVFDAYKQAKEINAMHDFLARSESEFENQMQQPVERITALRDAAEDLKNLYDAKVDPVHGLVEAIKEKYPDLADETTAAQQQEIQAKQQLWLNILSEFGGENSQQKTEAYKGRIK